VADEPGEITEILSVPETPEVPVLGAHFQGASSLSPWAGAAKSAALRVSLRVAVAGAQHVICLGWEASTDFWLWSSLQSALQILNWQATGSPGRSFNQEMDRRCTRSRSVSKVCVRAQERYTGVLLCGQCRPSTRCGECRLRCCFVLSDGPVY
jgi:hypothetical protein